MKKHRLGWSLTILGKIICIWIVLTYDQYIDHVILNLISHQEKLIDEEKFDGSIVDQPLFDHEFKYDTNDACFDVVVPDMFETLCDCSVLEKGPDKDHIFPNKLKVLSINNHMILISVCWP